jgi:hypothetical protein
MSENPDAMGDRRKREQLTVPVRIDDPGHDLARLRRRRVWSQAVAVLARKAQQMNACGFVELEMPPEVTIHAGWFRLRAGVSYRCIVMWVMFPLDGGPPGWRGRVDVAWEPPPITAGLTGKTIKTSGWSAS